MEERDEENGVRRRGFVATVEFVTLVMIAVPFCR